MTDLTIPGARYLPAVQALLAEQLGIAPEEARPTARLAEALRCDSLDIVEIVIAAEERFGIEITDAELGALRTVGGLLALLEAKDAPPPTVALFDPGPAVLPR
jgi:acyl carrier protein